MPDQVAISAHGPRAGTIEAYASALATGAEYVEFDIRRTGDAELAAFHNFVVTTLEDESIAALKARFPEVPVALSLGRDLSEVPGPRRITTRLSELRPMRRLRACRADWAAVNQQLARAGVLAQCHRAGIKTMIWTVDEDEEMRRWLADPRVTVLITNRPAEAVAMRASVRPGASPGA